MRFPPQVQIHPLSKPLHANLSVPGSKSITNRALILAALTANASRDTSLQGALQSEDTEVMIQSLARLGFLVEPDWPASTIRVRRPDCLELVPSRHAELFVGNSGTSMRFLTALAAVGHGRFRLDGVPRMRERPINDLLDALNQLGVRAASEQDNGCPPVLIEADGLAGGTVSLKGATSSQFLSGLLMAAPFAKNDLVIQTDGPLVSVPYITMTVRMMRQFGLAVEDERSRRFHVPAPQAARAIEHYAIEPDASAASYFFGAAAISGGEVSVADLPCDSLQGDIRFVDVLEQMGCRVERTDQGITIHGGRLRGIDIDMNDISDTVMTLAAVACFAEGPTTIRNVAHIRHKETDRLAALTTELRRLGAGVVECADGLTITPAVLRGAVVQTYDDHRMAMSLALIGLKVPGVVIDNPACVAKTYPRFFDDLERLR